MYKYTIVDTNILLSGTCPFINSYSFIKDDNEIKNLQNQIRVKIRWVSSLKYDLDDKISRTYKESWHNLIIRNKLPFQTEIKYFYERLTNEDNRWNKTRQHLINSYNDKSLLCWTKSR